MAVIELNPLKPRDAIAAYEARRGTLRETHSWMDLFEQDHAAMFTVAKSAGFDILGDIDAALMKALDEGQTLQSFSKELRPVLEAKGWWGRKLVTARNGDLVPAQLGSARRLQTIFNVNMRVSYAAGHWANFERNKKSRPYLRYVTMNDDHVRPAHARRHNLVLPVDHPYWDTWAPPCGWGCRCTLQSLSQRDIDRLIADGEKLFFEPPADTYRNFVNRRTGEVVRVPDGIDPGWAYNPGKAGWKQAALKQAGKLATAPPDLAAQAMQAPDWLHRPLGADFARWFDQAAAGGRVETSLVVAGALSPETLAALRAAGIDPQSAAITLTQDVVRHMIRDAKVGRGAGVPADILRTMPDILAHPRAVLLDKRDGALLYVFDSDGSALGKIVVRVGYSDKIKSPESGKRETITTNSVRTTGLVEQRVLTDTNTYRVLAGGLEE